MTTTRTTNRWRGIVAIALFASAIGVVGKRPDVLLCAIVGVIFAVYPRLTSAPSVDLELDRTVSDSSPSHDEPAEVTVTVRNVGDTILPDVRIVDGVPPMLPVTGGSARHAAVLRPDEAASFTYELTARHGTHRFEDATVIARDLSGMREVETSVSTETEIECRSAVPDVPLRTQSEPRAGRLVTDEGGSGIEFHRTRAYQSGDPLNRVDWNRYARTGELTTVEFHEERAASVVLCLDARAAAYRGRADEPHAVSYGVAAAEQLLSALLDEQDRVGIAAFGRDFLWLAPGSGPDHGARARRLLATHPTLSMQPPESPHTSTVSPSVADGGESALERQTTALRKRLGEATQVFLLSPLLDDDIVDSALSLEAGGTGVTVVSPDVTTAATAGGRLARVQRENRVSAIQTYGVPVVDWDTDESLGTVLLRAAERGATVTGEWSA